MRDLLPSLRQHLAARSAAQTTIKTYERLALAFLGFRGNSSGPPTQIEVEAFLARPRGDGKPRAVSARNQALSAIRVLYAVGEQELQWTAHVLDGIPMVREPARDPVAPTAAETRLFFQTIADTEDPVLRTRNLAILAVLAFAGLRVHEVVALNIDQVDFLGETLLSVRGKGGTIHDVVLNNPAVALLQQWIEYRKSAISSNEPALFLSASSQQRLSVRAIQEMVAGVRKKSGLARRISPHSFRHGLATMALQQGTDYETVASLLRHTDLNTTRKYIHLLDGARRTALDKLALLVPANILPQKAEKQALPEKGQGSVSIPPDPSCVENGFHAVLPPNPPRAERAHLSRSKPRFARAVCLPSMNGRCAERSSQPAFTR